MYSSLCGDEAKLRKTFHTQYGAQLLDRRRGSLTWGKSPPPRLQSLALAHQLLPFSDRGLPPPPNPGCHRLLGGGLLTLQALRCSLDAVSGLQGIDLLGQFGGG